MKFKIVVNKMALQKILIKTINMLDIYLFLLIYILIRNTSDSDPFSSCVWAKSWTILTPDHSLLLCSTGFTSCYVNVIHGFCYPFFIFIVRILLNETFASMIHISSYLSLKLDHYCQKIPLLHNCTLDVTNLNGL